MRYTCLTMIERMLVKIIKEKLGAEKAIVLMGARQVGKTTLVNSMFKDSADTIFLNGDEFDVQRLFKNISSTRLKNIFGGKKCIVLDEAQRIKDIGIKLKIIIDQIPDIQLVTTGSSSFDLTNQVNEPLTGRK